METIFCKTWNNFTQTIEIIKSQHAMVDLGGQIEETKMLFRGQADSIWDLSTTLERSSCHDFSVENYLNIAYSAAQKIEELTKHPIELDDWEENLNLVRHGEYGISPKILSYEYLVYLRHHGFPSPLLDWSLSPFVAAYFAFEPKIDSERAAVFVFIEHPTFGKSIIDREINISTYTHDVIAHPRHFAQHCQYSIATKQENGIMRFFPHKRVFERNRTDQDLLFKIEIPRAVREEALLGLEEKKVNRQWLFQPEDVLIEMLGEEHFGGNAI